MFCNLLFHSKRILNVSKGLHQLGSIEWPLVLQYFVAVSILFLFTIKGPQSIGKVVYATTILPYILITILLIRGISMEGGFSGIVLMLAPDFSKLLNIYFWTNALIQALLMVLPCGGYLTMSRSNNFNHPSYREALIIPVIRFFTAIYVGMATFSLIGAALYASKASFHELLYSIPMFVAFTDVLAKLPQPQVWSVIYFLAIGIYSISTNMILFETVVSGVVETFPSLRSKRILVAAAIAVVLFIAGLPLCTQGGIYITQMVDAVSSILPMVILLFVTSIVVLFVYGWKRLASDVKLMYGFIPAEGLLYAGWFATPFISALLIIVGLTNAFGYSSYYDYTGYSVSKNLKFLL